MGHGEMRNAYKILCRKGKNHLVRPSRTGKNNIKIHYFKDIGLGVWIGFNKLRKEQSCDGF